MVQVSFTLPMPHDKRAEGAALQLAAQDGHRAGDRRARQADRRRLHLLRRLRLGEAPRRPPAVEVVEREFPLLSGKEINRAIKRRLRRKLVVVGACIGTDAHTVGIDAILNIKGFAGEKGLEYYREIKVVNLGAQVLVPELVEQRPGGEGRRRAGQPGRHPARRAPPQHDGDVGRVPRGVPGRPGAAARRRRAALRGGLAGALGVDRIFGRGTTPGEVASYLVHALVAPSATGRSKGAMSTMTERDGPHGHDGPAPPLRPLQPRPLRRQPRRRRLLAGRLRRRRHRDVHPSPTATRACSRPTRDVQFLAPVRAGDCIEIEATLVRVGTRSREMEFAVRVVAAGQPRARRVRRRRPRPAGRRHDGPRRRGGATALRSVTYGGPVPPRIPYPAPGVSPRGASVLRAVRRRRRAALARVPRPQPLVARPGRGGAARGR